MKPHEVLKRLVLTENTYKLVQGQHTFVFEVPFGSNKIEIREAVEKAFSVRALAVNTARMPHKTRRVRGRMLRTGVRAGYKKAFVKVRPEDVAKIPLI